MPLYIIAILYLLYYVDIYCTMSCIVNNNFLLLLIEDDTTQYINARMHSGIIQLCAL